MDKKNSKIILMLMEETSRLRKQKELFDGIMRHIPGHVYWLDKNNVYLGCNSEHAKNVGLKDRKEIVGKTNYDMPWKYKAKEIDETNNSVMDTQVSYTVKESALFNGKSATYLSNKVPLRDNKNEIIGMLGISIDITEQEKLASELKQSKAPCVSIVVVSPKNRNRGQENNNGTIINSKRRYRFKGTEPWTWRHT